MPVSGQTAEDFAQEWRWSDFGTALGVPPGPVQGMAEDRDHVWVHTSLEVAYFDGFMWRRPPGLDSVANVTALHAVNGSSVALAGDGRLYVGDHQGFQTVEIPAAPEDTRVDQVAWQDSTLLYFTVTEGTPLAGRRDLYLRRGGVVSRVPVPGVLPTSTQALWPTQGGVYLTTVDALYRLVPPGEWLAVTEPVVGGNLSFTALSANSAGEAFTQRSVEIRQGLLWGAESELVERREEGQHLLRASAVTPSGARLAVYDDGSFWSGIGDDWNTVSLAPSRAQGIRSVFASRTGDVWLTSFEGIHLFRRLGTRWSRIQRDDPPGRNRINAFDYSEETGEIWLATGAGLVRHVDSATVEYFELGGQRLPGVTTVAMDSAGSTWFGSGGGFTGAYRLDADGSWELVGGAEGLGRIHQVAVDRAGRVYLLSLGDAGEAGAYLVGEDGALDRLQDPNGVLNGRVYSFAEGPGETLWFGSNLGIARLRDGQWTSWDRGDLGPGFRQAWSMAVAPDGTLWLSPGKDLEAVVSVFDADTGRLLPQDSPDRMSARGAWSVTFDEAGDLWAGTESGLSHLRHGIWSRIDSRHGLGATMVWPVRATPEQVWIGTANGLMILDRSEERAQPAPLVEIHTVEAASGRARWRWTAAGYRGEPRAAEIEVRYAVDDGPWSGWTRASSLDTVVGSGTHVLRVQSKGIFGQTSEPYASELRVLPPVYLRPIIFIPGALLAMSVLVVGVQARDRRRQRDAAVRESEGRLRALLELAPEGILIYHGDRNELVEANEQVQQLLGYSAEALLGRTPMGLCPANQASGVKSAGAMARLLARALEADEVVDLEWIFEHRDGTPVPTRLRLSRLPEPESHLVRLSLVDLTSQKREEAARRSLEIQLVQAQKLEAVGQLTGGVAHDFNNLLTVIRGNLEFLDRGDGDESRPYVEQAIQAADRGAELVKRLLAFSMRQTLAPDRIDLEVTMGDLLPLVERSLGESIRVALHVARDARWVKVDRAQLDSAIMNLAVNARDAMPRGGTLRISAERAPVSAEMAEAAEVDAGPYVRITVADTGSGMPASLMERVFEPFFTTKEVGKGSGLGLSMVYGFARQSGGFARITSQEGSGTQVHIYLPPSASAAAGVDAPAPTDAGAAAPPPPPRRRRRGVEDDEAVRPVLKNLLEFYGHDLVLAGSASEAEAHVARGFVPQVLLTDVVLPGARSGPELARDLQARCPGLGVALISGYPREHLPTDVEDGVHFLAKPFDGPSLERLVRAAAANTAATGSAR